MMDTTWDVIVIGAGHNGMCLAAYLLRAGLRVCVLERRTEEGGGLCTEEVTEPGFLHNLHSNYHSLVRLSPVYDDLQLLDNGVEYVLPEVQMGSVFADGTALTIHTDLDRTCASFARFSVRDADTFRRLMVEVAGYKDLLVRTLMFAPPVSIDDITRALVAWGVEERSEFLSIKLRKKSVAEFLDDHFEHPRIKAMLAFHAAICAYQPDVRGLAVSYPLLLGKITNWHLCVGGSHRLAHALMRVIVRGGGRVFPQMPVEEILVEDGRACGVRTRDGVFRARRAVVSSVDVHQTFEKLLPREHVPARTAAEVSRVAYQDASLFNLHLALDGLPRWHAASFDPDIDRAWIVNLGYESLSDLTDELALVRRGAPPSGRFLNVAVNSLYDPTDAPAGKATALVRVFAPYSLADGGPEAWRRVAGPLRDRCLARWAEASPDFARLVRKTAVETPVDIAEKIINYRFGDWMVGRIHPDNLLEHRPTDELAGYRTPVPGLYLCGASQHPHGYITFAPGYNCAGVMADDLGLDKWWMSV